MFDNFFSKIFGQKGKKKSIYNNPYYYDNQGFIKLYEKMLGFEREKLKSIRDSLKENKRIRDEVSSDDPRFNVIMESSLMAQEYSQQTRIDTMEDLILIMKNMVALERGVESVISRISQSPKVREDGQLWNEIKTVHLPRLRSFGTIMDNYAEKWKEKLKEEK